MAETQTNALWHPVRLRIVMALTGRRLTTQQIGLILPDVAQASLYRHIRRLVAANIIAAVEQRPVRGVIEKFYALAGDGLSINPDPAEMSRDDWERAFGAFTASLLGQFELYIGQEGADPVSDKVSFRSAPLYLSDDESLQLLTDLREIMVSALAHEPSPERRRRLLSTILVPDMETKTPGVSE